MRLSTTPRWMMLALAALMALAPAGWGQPDDEDAEAPAAPQGTTNLAIREGAITTVLHRIERDLGIELQPRGVAAEQVLRDFYVRDATAEDLLNQLNAELGWQWYQDDTMPPNVYHLYTDEDFRAMVLPNLVIEKVFFFENITADVAAEFIQEMLSEVGQLAVIPRTNEVIVTDLPQYIEAIERLRDQIDVRLYIRVFRIRHAEVDQVADAIDRLRSPEGSLEIDERNHTIIVEDLFQNIRRMDLMVELLDVGTVLETYPLNYLSEDDVSDLLAALDQIVTPDALLEVDYRTNLIILDDIPEVHELAAEIIAAFDRPTRQIMLQADLIQVRTTNSMITETSIQIADDLVTGATDGLSGFPGVAAAATDIAGTFPAFAVDATGVRFEYLSSHFRALLTASLSNVNTRLLLSPRIQVKDKEPAVIDVGGEVPFVTTTISDATATSTRTFTQQAVREGLLLEVTPFITNTGYVELQVTIENNDAEIQQRNVIDGVIDVVERRTQQVTTTLIIPDGATRVIAGLLSQGNVDDRSGVPFLTDLPYVGWLFGSRRQEAVRDNLMIFLTPTIIVEAATDYEWRPFFDERPVSARFGTTMPEDPGPLRPRDLDLLMPAIPADDLFDEEMIEAPMWLEDESLLPDMPPPMPEGIDPSLEPIPSPPLGPGPMGEYDPYGMPATMPAGSEEIWAASPEAPWILPDDEFSLPLVSEDLRAEMETGEEAEDTGGPRTSYQMDGVVSPSGALPATGTGVRSSTDSARSERSRTRTQDEEEEEEDDEEERRREREREEQEREPAERETNYRGR